jgi:hypothetical protein
VVKLKQQTGKGESELSMTAFHEFSMALVAKRIFPWFWYTIFCTIIDVLSKIFLANNVLNVLLSLNW